MLSLAPIILIKLYHFGVLNQYSVFISMEIYSQPSHVVCLEYMFFPVRTFIFSGVNIYLLHPFCLLSGPLFYFDYAMWLAGS